MEENAPRVIRKEGRPRVTVIEAIDLSKVFPNGHVALDGVSLKVNAGQIFCLLGANGAGKTTTIHIFFDFLKPSRGRALIRGIEVAARPLAAKRYAAYLSEDVALYEDLTAYENVRFFGRLGTGRQIGRTECRDALAAVGLQEAFFDRSPRSFSKGMRQKVGLAVCVVR